MASSYTSRIRLTKQADGENPNTWGTILNNQVIDLIDDAIASYTTISIGSAATVTLTENEGASDQSRSAFIELTGSVGGSNNTISLIIPAKSKSYVINNKVSANTTASDIVKMKTAGGDGYDIQLGAVGLVICDGTSVHSLNTKGFNLGTAASADIGVCTTNVPDTSLADIRYLRVSTSANVSLIGTKYIVGASASTPGNFVNGTNARAYNPIVTETDAELSKRILAHSKQESEQAAKRGVRIHNELELFFRKGCIHSSNMGTYESDIKKICDATKAVLDVNCGEQGWISEKSFCHKELGYGGKVDLYSSQWVIDFKTKDSIEDKKQLAFDSMAHQLVGYERGLPRHHSDTKFSGSIRRMANVFISADNHGHVMFHEWPQVKHEVYWNVFTSALDLWKHMKNYRPEEFNNEGN